ncbi:hypothetical protein GCM10020001_025190 [Nonomuraea salmonea]
MLAPQPSSNRTTQRFAPARRSASAISAEPTANRVSAAGSSQPADCQTYSLITACIGSRFEAACSVSIAPLPAPMAANPLTSNSFMPSKLVESGFFRTSEIGPNSP